MKRQDSPRILLVRPDHLGDVLLTLPAVAALRQALPAARLAYAVPVAAAAVPQHSPHLDATLTFPFPPLGNGSGRPRLWRETVAGEAARLDGRFDAALVVRPDDPWSGELVAAAGIPIRLGFDMPRTRPFLTHALPTPGDEHVATHAFALADALLAQLGVRAPVSRVDEPYFVVHPHEEDEAASVLAGAGADPHPVVLHPGSGWPLKNWPAARWRLLARELARRFDTRPVIAGAADERELASEAAAGTPAITLAGRLSLGAAAALHRRARLVISTDSGAVHLAAAVGARVVALFGPGDPVMFAPLCPPERRRIVRVGLPCSPCGTLEHPPCGATIEPDCVTGITVDAVLHAAADLMPVPAAARPRF